MLVTPQPFNEMQACKIFGCFWKGYMQSQAGSQGSCTQPELVRQLSLTIHLNPAAAVLGQTSFLLCLLADKISDRLWLWFSFGLHVQSSVKILVQPTQRLPSIGERVNVMFSVWTVFQLLFCQWTTTTHELLQFGPRLQTALVCPHKVYSKS